jgi:hypothetical protein
MLVSEDPEFGRHSKRRLRAHHDRSWQRAAFGDFSGPRMSPRVFGITRQVRSRGSSVPSRRLRRPLCVDAGFVDDEFLVGHGLVDRDAYAIRQGGVWEHDAQNERLR